ncbi:transketolase, thiamine diphosphate binding domain-containing protein [Ditylenchus destructor]|nr:transketolase, thiamine diphosphate binding domain-containing protein [Ditylenchus destructor]
MSSPSQVAELQDAANRMRISSIEQTSKANSGHPTSSVSAAEIMSTLFFAEMRYDVQHPKHVAADRFVLSKGHACPILYAAWEEAGLLTREQVLTLRAANSDLEGHPTPRLNFIDVATGSLGQGLSCAAGMAYIGKHVDKASYRVYCVLGDGETAEGGVWECAAFSSYYQLDNFVAIVDCNRLGQSQHTQLEHDVETYAKRFAAFGWHTITLDGHNIEQLLHAYAEAKTVKGKPTMIIAKTIKGKGIVGVEDLDGNHGKPVPVEKANPIREKLHSQVPHKWQIPKPIYDTPDVNLNVGSTKLSSPPNYKPTDKVATRQAYGTALLKLADNNKRVLALDGDMSNSTFSCNVKNKYPEQFIECFIAEQNMVGVGIGAGCRARTIPFVSTFAAFLGRAADHIRMSAVSFANIKYVGSHCGVSIGEDGPSQMALEDLAQFRCIPDGVVLYPTDAVSTERAVELAANRQGIVYIRLGRPALGVVYDNNETFQIGKSKVVKESPNDKAVLVGAGVTLYECLKAHDKLAAEGIQTTVIDVFSVKPIDVETLTKHAQRVGGKVVTVEDHYEAGGIGEAVAGALSNLPNVRVHSLHVKELPRSGTPDGLLDRYKISANHIVNAVKNFN